MKINVPARCCLMCRVATGCKKEAAPRSGVSNFSIRLSANNSPLFLDEEAKQRIA